MHTALQNKKDPLRGPPGASQVSGRGSHIHTNNKEAGPKQEVIFNL